MVQVLDLPAGNLEQPVSRMSPTICLFPHNTFHCLGHAGVIFTVDECIGWPDMYYGEPDRSLDLCTVLLPNSLPDWEFWLCQNYIGSVIHLFLDPQAGLSVEGFLQELHLASLCPVRLFVGYAVQGLNTRVI